MPASKTLYGLYRENPFQIYFTGEGFSEPRRDETRTIHPYPSEDSAWEIVRQLSIRTFVGKRSYLRQRIKNDARG